MHTDYGDMIIDFLTLLQGIEITFKAYLEDFTMI